MPDDGSFTILDRIEEFRHVDPKMQRVWLRQLIAAVGVEVGMEAMYPDYTPSQQGEVALEYRRLLARREAQRLYEETSRGEAEAPWVRDLDRIVERLELGLETRPEPSVGGLLYPSRVNAVYGTHTAGKTWLALHLSRLNMEAGGKTLVIDYEDSAVGITERCLAMDDRLAKSVRYLAPTGRIDAARLGSLIADEGITLVVLDSVGESLAMGGYDSNAERDVTQWFTEVPDALAALGPAVLVLDHIAKRQDGTPTPVGSFRKSAAITGAQFALENKVGFSRDRAGWSKLTCTKDRNGYFATGQVVGRVDFLPGVDSMSVELKRGETEAVAVTDRMELDVLNYVSERWALDGTTDEDGNDIDGRPTLTQIRGAVTGHNTKVREAVDRLVDRGFLERVVIATGPKSTKDLFKPGDPFEGADDSDDLL